MSRKAESGSVVVIHFSGHGYELPDQFDQGLIPATLTREMVGKITVTPRWGSTNLLTNNKHGTYIVTEDRPPLNPKGGRVGYESLTQGHCPRTE